MRPVVHPAFPFLPLAPGAGALHPFQRSPVHSASALVGTTSAPDCKSSTADCSVHDKPPHSSPSSSTTLTASEELVRFPGGLHPPKTVSDFGRAAAMVAVDGQSIICDSFADKFATPGRERKVCQPVSAPTSSLRVLSEEAPKLKDQVEEKEHHGRVQCRAGSSSIDVCKFASHSTFPSCASVVGFAPHAPQLIRDDADSLLEKDVPALPQSNDMPPSPSSFRDEQPSAADRGTRAYCDVFSCCTDINDSSFEELMGDMDEVDVPDTGEAGEFSHSLAMTKFQAAAAAVGCLQKNAAIFGSRAAVVRLSTLSLGNNKSSTVHRPAIAQKIMRFGASGSDTDESAAGNGDCFRVAVTDSDEFE